MPGQPQRKRLLLFGQSAIPWLLRDDFNDTLAAGAVNGTQAAPGPGLRTVVDTGARLSTSGGMVNIAAGGADGDPALWYGLITRTAGRILLCEISPTGSHAVFGYDSNQSGAAVSRLRFVSGALAYNNASYGLTISALTGTSFWGAIVQRTTGEYLFVRDGTVWKLIWVDRSVTGNVYPNINVFAAGYGAFTSTGIRIPDALWLPPVLATDTFTRANGAIGTSESSGPDGQQSPPLTWTGATWTISTNAAINTPTPGAETLADPSLEGTYTAGLVAELKKQGSPTLAESADAHTGVKAQEFTGVAANNSLYTDNTKYALTTGGWYEISMWCKRTGDIGRPSSTLSLSSGWNMAGASAGITSGSYTQRVLTARCTNGESYKLDWILNGYAGGNTEIIDDLSIKPLALSELFVTVPTASGNPNIEVAITRSTRTQAGVVLCLDDPTTPANFLIAYLDGSGNCRLDECVAGSYTSLISAAVTYIAGRKLVVVKDGINVRLYYDNALVGATTCTANVNTRHGLFSTYSSSQFTNLVIYPTGNGGEHAALEKYIA